MKQKTTKQTYTAPKAELLRLNAPLSILDTMSINTGWEDVLDGADEDQY